MDGRAQATLRNWLMGTAAAGLFCPGMLAAQAIRPTARTVAQPANPAVRVRPTAQAIRQTAYQPAPGDVQLAESEIQERLRVLYERDGREMPNMNLTPSQAPQAAAPPAAPRQATAVQPRYSSASRVTPAAARPNENRFTSFFKKMVPGGNRRQQAQRPAAAPRPMPAPSYPQPALQPAPPQQRASTVPPVVNLPQPAAAPQAILSQPTQTSAPPQLLIPPSPAATSDDAVTFEPPIVRDNATADEPRDLSDLSDESQRFPAVPAEADFDAEIAEEMEAAPALPPAPAEPSEFSEDFPNPFGAGAETPAEPALETASDAPAVETSPYTGKTLDTEAPATLPTVETIEPLEPVDEVDLDDASNASKMRRIIQRSDMKGLKGFCPVTLRDQRELADSRPEFSSTHRGQKFFFASKNAQAKFEQDPARYAPVAFGADVVVLTDDQDVSEGTLDFAAWFKGRLYLFGSQETHDTFVNEPEKYATPPGIE